MEVESTSVKLRSLGLSTAEREKDLKLLVYHISTSSLVEIRQAEILVISRTPTCDHSFDQWGAFSILTERIKADSVLSSRHQARERHFSLVCNCT